MANKTRRFTSNVKREQKSSKPTTYKPGVLSQDQIPASTLLIARTQQNFNRLTPTDTPQLQRTMGNRAVSLMLAPAELQKPMHTSPDFTEFLKQMNEVVNKQQKLLEQMRSLTGTKPGQKQENTLGDGQKPQQSSDGKKRNPKDLAQFLTQQMMNPIKFAAAIKGGQQPGKKPPVFPPKALNEFLKQMKLESGMKGR